MSQRNARRKIKKMSKATVVDSKDLTQILTSKMGQAGHVIMAEFKKAVGNPDGSYTPGHAADFLMRSAAVAEEAALTGDADAYIDASIIVLFMARDIAISKGYIKISDKPASELS